MKRCSQCEEEKELSEFNKNKSSKDGFQYSCRNCDNKNNSIYYLKNRDTILERQKEHNKANPLRAKEYYINNKDYLNECCRKYSKQYYKDNKNEISSNIKEYRRNNKEKFKEYYRDWEKNKLAVDPEFKKRKNLRSINRYNLNRSCTKEKSSSSKLMQLFYIQNYECIYCKVDISESKHIDHLIPLSKGGSNLITNLALSCPDCNMRKHDKALYQFLEEEKIDYNTFVLNLGERNDKYFRDEEETESA